MQLQFLGSGSAFSMDNFQSNMLLKSTNGNLLFDCGGDIRFALKEQNLSYKNIDNIYISHLHADHVGGLEYIGFCRKFDSFCKKPNLYIAESLVDDIWSKTLSGGMRSIQGAFANLNTYFNVFPMDLEGKQQIDCLLPECRVQLVQMVHVVNGFGIVPSYGMILSSLQKTFITSDTQFCPAQLMDFYNMCDLIFQDCETSPFSSKVHAHYTELATLPDNVKSKMSLYHCQDNSKQDCKKDGFLCFASKGEVFNLDKTMKQEG